MSMPDGPAGPAEARGRSISGEEPFSPRSSTIRPFALPGGQPLGDALPLLGEVRADEGGNSLRGSRRPCGRPGSGNAAPGREDGRAQGGELLGARRRTHPRASREATSWTCCRAELFRVGDQEAVAPLFGFLADGVGLGDPPRVEVIHLGEADQRPPGPCSACGPQAAWAGRSAQGQQQAAERDPGDRPAPEAHGAHYRARGRARSIEPGRPPLGVLRALDQLVLRPAPHLHEIGAVAHQRTHNPR